MSLSGRLPRFAKPLERMMVKSSPFELTPCNENALFAKSIPSVDTRFMGLPPSEGSISQLNPDTSVSFRDGEVPYMY
jgi:hypothetical protein